TLYPYKSSYARVPASAESESIGDSPFGAVFGVIAVLNPPHHEKRVISQASTLFDGSKGGWLCEREWSRMADVEPTLNDVVRRDILIGRLHRQPQLIAVKHEVGRYDSRGHASDILDIASPGKAAASEQQSLGSAGWNDSDIAHSQARPVDGGKFQSGKPVLLVGDVNLLSSQKELFLGQIKVLVGECVGFARLNGLLVRGV